MILKRLPYSGNALTRVQQVHEAVDLWDITFCRLLVPLKPADLEAQSSALFYRTDCTRRSKFLTNALILLTRPTTYLPKKSYNENFLTILTVWASQPTHSTAPEPTTNISPRLIFLVYTQSPTIWNGPIRLDAEFWVKFKKRALGRSNLRNAS